MQCCDYYSHLIYIIQLIAELRLIIASSNIVFSEWGIKMLSLFIRRTRLQWCSRNSKSDCAINLIASRRTCYWRKRINNNARLGTENDLLLDEHCTLINFLHGKLDIVNSRYKTNRINYLLRLYEVS